jgi:peroxiredoxin
MMRNKIKPLLFSAIAVYLLTGLGFSGLQAWQKSGPSVAIAQVPAVSTLLPIGAVAPDFSLKGLDGNLYSLSSYRGKSKVIVEFFASWCPHCQHSVPQLNGIHEKYKVLAPLLSINVGERPGEPSTAPEFKTKYDVHYSILEISSRSIIKQFGLKALPTVYVVDKAGKIAYAHEGELTKRDARDLEKTLK